MEFNEILKSLRLSKNITQDDLAKYTGLKRSAIGMYESGKRRPDFETLEILADYFNVDMNTLLGSVKPPSFSLSAQEEAHIKKYRQLSDMRRYVVDEVLDAQYQKQLEDASAQKEGERLG